ncbi:MAG: hypothetical protein GY756_19535 [bacterium]|nr:hypothetical protein [bacterium]
MFKESIKIFNIISVIILFLSSVSYGQVATPSFDTTILSDMPASVGWRDKSTVGTEIINGNNSVSQEVGSFLTTVSITYYEASYMVATKVVGPFYQETYRSIKMVERESDIVMSGNGTIYTYSEKSRVEKDQLSLGVRLGPKNREYFSVGVNLNSALSITEGSQYSDKLESNMSSYGLGGSFKYEYFYIAAGYEYTNMDTGTNIVGNSWDDLIFGLAFVLEERDFKIRVEYSIEYSAESLEPASGSKYENLHVGEETSKLSGEIFLPRFNDLLLRYEKKTVIQTTSGNTVPESNYFTLGVVWMPPSGWIFGGYYIYGDETMMSYEGYVGTLKTEYDIYRINIGFAF